MTAEAWCQEYERSRYLRNVEEPGLQRRITELSANLWSTGPDGQVTGPRNNSHREGILKLLIQTLYEVSLRTGAAIDFSEEAYRNKSSASYIPVTLSSPFIGSPKSFSKFGEKKYLRDSFDTGTLRIAPAEMYSDASLNAAQYDRELEHFVVTPNESLMFKLYGKDADGNDVEIPVERKELFRYMMVDNFYVWCCSYSYDSRTFRDFNYDAALVIRKMDIFVERIAEAVSNVRPDLKMVHGPLTYYDPYTVQRDQLKPIFFKKMQYLYQNEYRFAWEEKKGADMKPFMINIGPMHDIAEYYETV